MSNKTKILHIITGLNVGGVEICLRGLVDAHSSNDNYLHSVISLTNLGPIGLEMEGVGINVMALNMSSFYDIPLCFFKLAKRIWDFDPDIVQTWMYHADLFGGLVAKLVSRKPIVWGVHCTDIPKKPFSPTRLVVGLCSLMSGVLPDKIICGSDAVKHAHFNLGYPMETMEVIPYGCDLYKFNGNLSARDGMRKLFNFTLTDLVIGIIGRFDELKDHKSFVSAAGVLKKKYDYLKFLMVGRGLDSENKTLVNWVEDSQLGDSIVLAGERRDIPACLSCLDLFCISSVHEGGPIVVIEAMAMGIPCVVTNVGSARNMVLNTGICVEPGNSKVLADGLEKMLLLGINDLKKKGIEAQQRVIEHYSKSSEIILYEKTYSNLLQLKIY